MEPYQESANTPTPIPPTISTPIPPTISTAETATQAPPSVATAATQAAPAAAYKPAYEPRNKYEEEIELENQEFKKNLLPQEIITAIQQNNTEYLKENINPQNIDKRTSSRSTPLILAVENGHLDIVKLLLEKGATVDLFDNEGKTALMYAAENGDIHIAEHIFKKKPKSILTTNAGEKKTVLMYAAEKGQQIMIKLILDMAADTFKNKPESTDTMYAVLNKLVNIVDINSRTALMFAAANGHTETVSFLIDKGADILITDLNGKTALMFAAENGHTEIVSFLIGKGADILITDSKGKTALMFAASNGHLEVVRLLVNKALELKNIDYINLKNTEGSTALDLANNSNRMNVVQLFLKTPEVQVSENFKLNPKGINSLDVLAKNLLEVRKTTNQAFAKKTSGFSRLFGPRYAGNKSTKKQKGGKKSKKTHKKQQQGGKKSRKQHK